MYWQKLSENSWMETRISSEWVISHVTYNLPYIFFIVSPIITNEASFLFLYHAELDSTQFLEMEKY